MQPGPSLKPIAHCRSGHLAGAFQLMNSHRPTFIWQGLLILLPAVILAAVGLYGLRQDRALVWHQAQAQAKYLARDWGERFTSSVPLPKELPALPDFSTGSGEAELDPIFRIWSESDGAISVFFSSAGAIQYPPARLHSLEPELLRPEKLPGEIAVRWEEFLNLVNFESDMTKAGS
jgi:hypothetical protein